MKNRILFFAFVIVPLFANAQSTATPDPDKKIILVEASCGQCNFALPGKGCELAIRMDGKAYYVTGTDIDDHGDAHAHDGFCEAIKIAEVQGELVGDKFNVSYFKLKEETIQQDTEK